jgi:predicted transcriptional regulator
MVTTLNLPDELHAKLKSLAEAEHRSVNATILVAVERYIEDSAHRAKVAAAARDVAVRDKELLDRLAK